MKVKSKFAYLMSLIFVGLMGTICLQSIWLYNTFKLIDNNVREEAFAIITEALGREAEIRFSMTPPNTEILSGTTSDTIPPNTYLYERLTEMGYPMVLENVDSIVGELLKAKNLNCMYSVQLVDFSDNNDVILQSRAHEGLAYFNIQSKAFPIRSDYTQAVRLILVNPQEIFFMRMGLLLIGTVLLAVSVIACILCLLRIISNLNIMNNKREEFVNSMIHDMKSPLTSILITLKFLRSGKMDDKPDLKNNYCDIAINETNQLLSLANKALTMARLESGKIVLNKSLIDLEEIVMEQVNKYSIRADKKIVFNIFLKASHIYADVGYLKEIISNLIENSIKYSDKEVIITISSEVENDFINLKVHDNGFGISQKDQRIIFNKFERGEAAGKRKNGATGFGLGLSFVNQVVESHEGRIQLNSIEGEFTEFSMYFPKQETIENNL